jgi:hypothetical protein
MSRYAGRDEIQRAVNLHATGMSSVAVARAMNKARGTVQGWLRAGGIAERSGITPKVETVVEEVPPAVIKVRVKAGSSNRPEGAVTKVLAIGDCHASPDTPCKERFQWMGRFAADLGVDTVVQIGDFATLDSLNSHIPNESLLGKTKSPFSQDLADLRESMGLFDEGLGSHKVRKVVALGNHERRAWFYEDSHPEVAGILTGELTSTFEQFNWEWSEYGKWVFINGVGFIHAPLNKLGKTMGSESRMNVLSKMVFDMVRGHDHQEYTQPQTKFGPIGHVTLVGLGCALPYGHVESYATHCLNGWSWGVKELLIRNGRIDSAKWYSMLELQERYSP